MALGKRQIWRLEFGFCQTPNFKRQIWRLLGGRASIKKCLKLPREILTHFLTFSARGLRPPAPPLNVGLRPPEMSASGLHKCQPSAYKRNRKKKKLVWGSKKKFRGKRLYLFLESIPKFPGNLYTDSPTNTLNLLVNFPGIF